MSGFPRATYRSLGRYSPDRRPVSVDLCDNTNLRGAHPAAIEALRAAPAGAAPAGGASAGPDAIARYPSVYADRLKAAVAQKFGVPAESVTTGCGSDDLLDSTFRAVCEPGDRVVFLDPTFSMIEPFAAMNGLEAIGLPGWPDPPAPERLLEADPALIYLCRPNNPTGGSLERAWIDALLRASGPGGPVVLIDEAYIDFSDYADFADSAQMPGMVTEAPGLPRFLVLRTMSKAYGLAGLRVGFAVGDPAVIAEVEKSRGPYKVGQLAERAALAALEDRQGWVPEIVGEIRENRVRLASALEERGFSPLPSDANFLCVPLAPRLAGWSAEAASGALRERDVAVRPFPALPGIGEALRVTLGPWPLMERFLEALDDVVRSAPEGLDSPRRATS